MWDCYSLEWVQKKEDKTERQKMEEMYLKKHLKALAGKWINPTLEIEIKAKKKSWIFSVIVCKLNSVELP